MEMQLLAEAGEPGAWALWAWDGDSPRRVRRIRSFNDAYARALRAGATLRVAEDVWLEMTALGQAPPLPPAYVVVA